MREISKQQVVDALRQVGILPGDGLLVHSAIQFLGKPMGGVGMYLDSLLSALNTPQSRIEIRESRDVGIDSRFAPHSSPLTPHDSRISTSESRKLGGTIAVPTFNFAFARGEPYDPQSTPSQGMGAFSEHVRMHPQARRTSHPMQSLAVLGRYGDDLASRDTPSAFDPGSAFERMLELDFKLLLLGADVQAVSMVHYSEQRANVPYRYWKEFAGRVKTIRGWEERTYRMFARDLNIDPQLHLHPIQELLEQRQQWRSAALNYGQVAACRLVDFVAAADDLLARDPRALID